MEEEGKGREWERGRSGKERRGQERERRLRKGTRS